MGKNQDKIQDIFMEHNDANVLFFIYDIIKNAINYFLVFYLIWMFTITSIKKKYKQKL